MTTEERIATLETGLKALCREMDRRFEEALRALTLQAHEYERRLHDLNGETGRMARMQERHLLREVADEKFVKIDAAIEDLRRFKDRAEGRMALTHPLMITVIGAVGGLLASIIALMLRGGAPTP